MLIRALNYDYKTKKYIENQIIYTGNYYELTEPNGEKVPVFNWQTFPFNIVFKNIKTYSKQGHINDRIKYLDLIASFDIETTTIKDENPFAIMYHWQFCIDQYVFFGRTWEEFILFFKKISGDLNLFINNDNGVLTGKSLVVYVHNLAYEFQFMRRFLPKIHNPLITDKYAPLIIPVSNGITWRCSYRLTNKSLEKFTKGQPHAKLSGDLDYSIIRTPNTILTNIEQCYCYNDVRGLNEALKDLFEHEEYNIANMPLTSTGFVRNDCRKAMNTPQNRQIFNELSLNEHTYQLCREAFRGGNTHANFYKCGKVFNNVNSADIASSYPAAILTRTFPMSKFIKINPKSIIKNWNPLIKYNCLLLKAVFTNIKYIGDNGMPYLSRSKCFFKLNKKEELIEDNGRVYQAPLLMTTITEIDFYLITKDYKFDKVEFIEAYKAKRGMLPQELRNTCFNYYKQKTELKGSTDPEDIYNYNKAKARLNSIYGCMVMRIDRQEWDYNDEYINKNKTDNITISDQITKYYESRTSFLAYQWGVWVTAWARYTLFLGQKCAGADIIYCDTDSVKYIGDHKQEFDALNNKLHTLAVKFGAVAYNKNNEEFAVGIFDPEPQYRKFKTLGAKKYIYTYDNKTICATISGVSKKIGKEFFTKNGFDAFTNECIIPNSGKIVAHYNDDPIHWVNISGVEILTGSSLALIDGDYTIHIKPDYISFLDYINKSIKKYYS